MKHKNKIKPNLFIVGEPKCGTTALHELLKQHPEIFMSEYKEPDYFSKDFHKESDNFHNKNKTFPFRSEKQYLKLFSKAHKEKIIGESSTTYLYSKLSASEIHKFNPKANIIAIFREPTEFLYSLHAEYQHGMLGIKDFDEELMLEKSRKNGKNIPKNVRFPSYLFYSERVGYANQIKRFIKLFPKSQIKIIIFDDFKEDNFSICKEIFKFLKVDDSFKLKKLTVNLNKVPRFKLFKKIAQSPIIYSIPKKLLNPLLYLKLKNTVYGIITKNQSRPKLSINLKKNLMKKFKQEVIKLNELLHKEKYLSKKRNLVNEWEYDKIK